MHEDHEGNLWVATNGGLNWLRDGKIARFTVNDGLFDDAVYRVLEDSRQNLWFSCNKGIFRVSKKELDDFAQGKIKKIRAVVYGKSDGMKSSECNGGTQPAGWKTRDGRLWFPTTKGVVVIDPENIKTNKLPPPLVMEQIMTDGETLWSYPNASRISGNEIQISPGKEKFEFHYTALSFTVPERVRFRYLLEGFDREWVDAGTRRAAYYTHIPPGHYQFKVLACNDDGVWSTHPASFRFYLQPYFLAALLAAFAAHRFRLRRVRTRFSAILAERTRIACDLHDTLAQSISGVVLQLDAARCHFGDRPDESQHHLLRAADLARDGLLQARRAVWQLRDPSLQPGDIAQALIDMAQQLSVDSGIPIKVVISGEPLPLPEASEEQLLRISQEAITNALKHAQAQWKVGPIDSKPGKGTTITVSLTMRDSI